jgi:hypothetical protein
VSGLEKQNEGAFQACSHEPVDQPIQEMIEWSQQVDSGLLLFVNEVISGGVYIPSSPKNLSPLVKIHSKIIETWEVKSIIFQIT